MVSSHPAFTRPNPVIRPRTASALRKQKKRGFSLVLSLAVMAMLLLLCVGGAALLSIQLRVAQASVSVSRAQMNAMVAARIAFGELQRLAGNDRRVTAPATIFDADPTDGNQSEGVNLPRLTGVWRGKTVTSSYATKHDEAFAGWLVSGVNGLQGASLLNYPKTTTLTAANALRLLSAASPAPASAPEFEDKDSADVYATAEPISGKPGDNTAGSMAWWISDENQKANVGMRIPAAGTVTPLQSAQNSPRFGLKQQSDGEFAGFPDTLVFNPAIISRELLAFDKPSSATPGSPAWLTNPHNYFHHITPYSESLLTDVVNGGLKYDLSLLFGMDKLPDGYFGDAAFVALESKNAAGNPYVAAKGNWITPDIAGALNVSTLAANNLKEWTCWGDVWNYARIYRHPAFNKSSGMLMNSTADAHGNSTNPLDLQKNVNDLANLSPWREPVITQFQMVLGYRVKPSTTQPGKFDLYMVMRPYIQLWNPYNVPLKFTGSSADSFLARVLTIPGSFRVTCTDSSGGGGTYFRNNFMFLSQSSNFNIYQPYIDFANALNTPMAPGEVRVMSPTTNSIVNSTRLNLTPGLRPFGGFETKLSSDTAAANGIKPFDGTATVVVDAPTAGTWSGNAGVETTNGLHVWNDLGRVAYSGIYQKDAPGRGWTVNFKATDGNQSKQLMNFDTTPVTSTTGQMAGQGRFCTLITMRLRSETVSNQKFPALGYGDPLRWVFTIPGQSNFAKGQDVRMNPYEFVQSKITSDTDAPPNNPSMNANGNLGYAFTGYTPANGVSAMVFSHLPLAPLGGLGELRDARLGGGAAYTRSYTWTASRELNARFPQGASVVTDAFGNSFMHPMILQTAVSGTSPTFVDWQTKVPNENFYDFSWIMNADLWDSYCVTGLAAQDSPIAALLPEGTPKALDTVASDFFVNGKSLPNKRLLLRDYGVGGATMKSEVVDGSAPAQDGYAKSAAMISVNGGFNINSTSVRAWRALLSGLNGVQLPKVDSAATLNAGAITVGSGDNPVLRSPIQSGPLADINSGANSVAFNQARALAGRKLSDAQLTKLAQKIVEQVKKRGPFLSMGEFVNRRLETGEFGEKGALQAAIDASGVNDFATSGSVQQVTASDLATLVPALPNQKAAIGSQARGTPGYIAQADLLGPLATQLTPRSDTFTIRACGTAEDGATANVELVVRRTAAFINGADAPFAIPDITSSTFKTANKAFGRRFVIVASRWLKQDEI